MLKPFSLIFFVAVFLWLGSIVITSDPSTRINRTCEPVNIVGGLSVSVTMLANSGMAPSVQHFFDSFNYGCRYTVWRQFFEQDWIASQAEQIKSGAAETLDQVQSGQVELLQVPILKEATQ
jgi:hypothetical protein